MTCSELVHSAQSQGGGEGRGRRREQTAVGCSGQQGRMCPWHVECAGMRVEHMERKDVQ